MLKAQILKGFLPIVVYRNGVLSDNGVQMSKALANEKILNNINKAAFVPCIKRRHAPKAPTQTAGMQKNKEYQGTEERVCR